MTVAVVGSGFRLGGSATFSSLSSESCRKNRIQPDCGYFVYAIIAQSIKLGWGNSIMMQERFIERVVEKVKVDPNVIGLAVAGSYITQEMDEFSDVDLILITTDKVAPDFLKMEQYAKSFGSYLSGFTGEHVGERRVLICLYDDPLLHVDIKFLTLDEFGERVEDPVVVFDRQGALEAVLRSTRAEWPPLNFQWIEDRFWTWVHYATLKLGRGENFEALDFLSFVRTTVTSPLLQIKNGKLPRGLRKVEMNFSKEDVGRLIGTIAAYDSASLFASLENTVSLYQALRQSVFPAEIVCRTETERRVMEYLREIKKARLTA